MKIMRNILCSALLCTGWLFGTANAQEKVAEVKTVGADCTKAVLSLEQPNPDALYHLAARFIVQNLPEYNSYSCSFSDSTAEKIDLQTELTNVASWLIVVDVSDPDGRRDIIKASKATAKMLVDRIDETSHSPFRLLTLARDLEEVRGTENILDWLAKKPSVQDKANTNLWIGLTRALREQMPETSKGLYENLPRGVILISDGVDESPQASAESNFELLIQEANKMGVPIHTIAFPHKDSGRSDTERHKGFNALQRLSMRTNGHYITYDKLFNYGKQWVLKLSEADQELRTLLSKTAADVLKLSIPLDELKGGKELSLQLRRGNREQAAKFNIKQADLAPVYGNLALIHIFREQSVIKEADIDPSNSAYRDAATKLGELVKKYLFGMPNRAEIFSFTTVDSSFAERVRKILDHVDATPALKEESDFLYQIGNYIINKKADLPQPTTKSDTTNVVVNTSSSSSAASQSEAEEEEGLQSWVWWFVAAGGGTMLILFFALMARIAGGNRGAAAPVAQAAPRAKALAMLVNKNNPSQSWPITKNMVTVGRSGANDVSMPDLAHVSSQHCTIRRGSNGTWQITDNHSTNGLVINGSKVTSATLNNGTVITIGDHKLEFRIL